VTRVANRYPRVACLVPFCRCGATCYPPEPGLQIICPKHYRLVDRSLKALRRKARKAGRFRLASMLWRRIASQAVERGAMI